ncbi:MAG: hypothetical protein IH899_05285 [Planctomycetes bacterium]|nr:hypothetical protein [Planctomycetota bacterium]
MTIPVSLRDVVMEMDALIDECSSYLNKRTGELVSITDDEMVAAEDEDEIDSDKPEWERQMLEKAREVIDSDDFLSLPSKFDIHEYSIMEKFCWSCGDQKIGEELEHAIRGSGAFRRFKDAIHNHGIADDWYRFRERAFENIAIDWLEANEIPYTKKTETGD